MSCFYSPPQSAFQCSRLGVGSLPGEDILASLRSKGAMSTKIPGETPWIDAWIRWERKSKEVYDCSADGDGSEEGNGNDDAGDDYDDATLPAATDTYSFAYANPRTGEPDIVLELGGFPPDSEQIWNSTGLTLWPSSRHLCDYLVQNAGGMLPRGERRRMVLELGSGLGRCGLLAYHLLSHFEAGDRRGTTVCLTDGDTDVLKQLRDNVRRNVAEEEGGGAEISCHQLLWGMDEANKFRSMHTSGDRFDLLLGSDLLYVTKVIAPLFETVQSLLRPCGIFVMAHCSRREGNEVELDMVLEAADDAGFEHKVLDESDDISIFSFTWKENPIVLAGADEKEGHRD